MIQNNLKLKLRPSKQTLKAAIGTKFVSMRGTSKPQEQGFLLALRNRRALPYHDLFLE